MILRGNFSKYSNRSNGFALPTVLISSIIMITVLVVAISSTTAVRTALKSQYYNQLAKTAADAGVAYAKACLDANDGKPKWKTATPLKPDTDCAGIPLAPAACPLDPTNSCHFVLKNSGADDLFGTSFYVGCPSGDCNSSLQLTDITSTGVVKLFKSGGGVSEWRQYKQTAKTSRAFVQSADDMTTTGGTIHTCSIASDNKVYCWGSRENGRLGDGCDWLTCLGAPYTTTPKVINDTNTYKSISSGYSHTCGIRSDNKAYCWGYNMNGQLGDGTYTQRNSPVAVSTSVALNGKTIKSISAGGNHTCAIASDDKLYCWGSRENPVVALFGLTIVPSAVGLLGDSTINTTGDSTVPVAVDLSRVFGGKVKSVSAGANHNCLISMSNQAYCWGNNIYGQLGNGIQKTYNASILDITLFSYEINENKPIPFDVNKDPSTSLWGKQIKSISVGGTHTCAIADDNNAYCWGSYLNGEIGDGSTYGGTFWDNLLHLFNGYKVLPSPITTTAVGLRNVKSISAGSNHTCIITYDNNLYCWGLNKNINTNGVIGANNAAVINNYPNPQLVYEGNDQSVDGLFGLKFNTRTRTLISISAGSNHSCVTSINTNVSPQNELACWGDNMFAGVIGNGNTANGYFQKPIKISDGSFSPKINTSFSNIFF